MFPSKSLSIKVLFCYILCSFDTVNFILEEKLRFLGWIFALALLSVHSFHCQFDEENMHWFCIILKFDFQSKQKKCYAHFQCYLKQYDWNIISGLNSYSLFL